MLKNKTDLWPFFVFAPRGHMLTTTALYTKNLSKLYARRALTPPARIHPGALSEATRTLFYSARGKIPKRVGKEGGIMAFFGFHP